MFLKVIWYPIVVLLPCMVTGIVFVASNPVDVQAPSGYDTGIDAVSGVDLILFGIILSPLTAYFVIYSAPLVIIPYAFYYMAVFIAIRHRRKCQEKQTREHLDYYIGKT